MQAFGQAAVGLHLLRTGKTDEARPVLIEAGRQRLSTLQERYRKSVYASPLPYWTDQLLLEFAIAATLSAGGTPDYDLLLGAHVVLNRSIETSADDALASQSIQASDEKKRIAQSVRTIEYQRAAWEKTAARGTCRPPIVAGQAKPGDDRPGPAAHPAHGQRFRRPAATPPRRAARRQHVRRSRFSDEPGRH